MDIIENRPILAISDLQIPYENILALPVVAYAKRHFGIPDENVLGAGDEVDSMWASFYPKSPEAKLTVGGELRASREKVKEWANAFPKMKIAISNHGMRWVKKAAGAEIPSELLRSYREIIGAPDGWQWRDEWLIKTKHPFLMIHGTEYSGQNATREMIKDKGISIVHGHLHSHAQVVHVRHCKDESGEYFKRWGMNTGCLIDPESYAFDYEKKNRHKPCLGFGVIFNNGSTPVWIPMEAYADKLPVQTLQKGLENDRKQMDFFA